jgi:hypothetical protein
VSFTNISRPDRHPVQIHVTQRQVFDLCQSGPISHVHHRRRFESVFKRRPMLFVPKWPFQDNDPCCSNSPCFPQRFYRIVGLMQHMPKEDQIKRIVREGYVLRLTDFESHGWELALGFLKQHGVNVNGRNFQTLSPERLREDPRACADIQDTVHTQSLQTRGDHPVNFKQSKSLGRSQSVGVPMKSAFMRI